MGADLLLAMVAMPDGREPDWQAARQHIAESPIEVLDPAGIVEGGDDDSLAEWRDRLDGKLEALRLLWEGEPSRDVDHLAIGGYDVLITGGPSWGDSPTSAFEAIADLDAAGALTAAGFPPDVSRPLDEVDMEAVIG